MLLPNSKTLKKFLFKKCIYLFIGLCRVLVTAHSIFSCGMWYLNPWPGVKLVIKALYWELGVLATGPAGKSQNFKGTSKYLKVERVSLYSAGKEPTCSAGEETQFDSWVGKIPWRRDRLRTPVFLGFTGSSAGKESACNAGDLGSILGLGRSLGEGKDYLLQYSGLENSMDCVSMGSQGVGHDWVTF